MGDELNLFLGGATVSAGGPPDVAVQGEPGSELGTGVSVADVDGDGMADALVATNDSARLYSLVDNDLGLRVETTFGDVPRVSWASSKTTTTSVPDCS